MNIYLLLSGILSISLSLLHAIFGERNYFQSKKQHGIAGYVPYQQITVVMILQGLGLIYSAFNFNYLLPTFILLMIIGNLLAFVIICIKENETGMIRASVPQLILFGIVIVLLVLGIN